MDTCVKPFQHSLRCLTFKLPIPQGHFDNALSVPPNPLSVVAKTRAVPETEITGLHEFPGCLPVGGHPE